MTTPLPERIQRMRAETKERQMIGPVWFWLLMSSASVALSALAAWLLGVDVAAAVTASCLVSLGSLPFLLAARRG